MSASPNADWEEVDAVLDEALDRPPNERAAFLDRACEGRPALREEVEQLLDAEAQAPNLLQGEALSFAAPAYDPAEDESIAEDPLSVSSRRVGPYRLTDEIGRGGMSRVFRAVRTDGGFDQTVAVKLLRVGLDTPAARRRFRVEQQVLATLQHPHIAALLDGGLTADDVPYLVMEHVEGRPITTYCDDEQLPVEDRLALLRDVGVALRHAHRNLVVHRDLKPANVLVTDDGTVKLLDFGIAKLLDDAPSAVTAPDTRTGVRPMTPAYAAPEQVEENPVSTATDVYQMGVLAYEVLTGHRPFEGHDRFDIERVILNESPDRPSTVVVRPRPAADTDRDTGPATPEAIAAARNATPRQLRHTLEGDLDTIVRTALRKEPDRRYPSVDEWLDDLDRYKAGRPVKARPATLDYRLRKFVRRNRWGVAVAAAFLALVIGFGALLVQQRERARQEAQTAELVSSYLVNLFNAGGPYGTPDTVAARDLVRRGLDRVERLEGRPVVQAEMIDALGRASQGIGEWGQADSLLRRALTLRRRHLDPPHPDLVASLLHVAEAKWQSRRFWEARPLYEEALAMSRRLDGTAHRATILEGLARTMAVRGSPDSAETLMRRAIDRRRRRQSTTYHGLPLDQMALARIVQRQGRPDEAERLYRAGLRRMQDGTGYTAIERVRAYNTFGDLLRNREKPAAAETYYRKALTIAKESLDRGHPRARRARDKLYDVLIGRGQYDRALSLARTDLALAKQQYTTPSYPVARAYQRVGHLLDNTGRSAEAEPLLRRAVRLWEAQRGPDHIRTHSARVRYGLCLAERGRLQKADRLLRTGARALRRTAPDSTTVDLARMRAVVAVGQGSLYARRQDWDRAVTALNRGYALRREQVGLRAPLTQRALRALATAHDRAGRPTRAAALRDSLLPR